MADATTLYKEGMELLAKREKSGALAKFEAALAADANHVEAQIERAYLVLETRDWGKAQTEMERAQKLSEQSLGNLEVYKGKFWTAPETKSYVRAIHGIGVCQLKQDRLEEAKARFRHVLELVPSDPTGAKFMLSDIERRRIETKPKGAKR